MTKFMNDSGESETQESTTLSDDVLLGMKEGADLLGVSTSTLRRLQSDRFIPFFKIGRCVRFSVKDLKEYLAKQRYAAIPRDRY